MYRNIISHIFIYIIRNSSQIAKRTLCTNKTKNSKYEKSTLYLMGENQGNKARKINCCCVYSAYILKPVLSGRNL